MRKNKILILIIVIVFVGVILIFYGYFLKQGQKEWCKKTEINYLFSSNNTHKAERYVWICEDLTDSPTMTMVDVITSKKDSSQDNALEILGIHKDDLRLNWDGENILRIDFNGDVNDILGLNLAANEVMVKLFNNNEEVTFDKLFGQEFVEKFLNKPGEYEPWLDRKNDRWVEFGGEYDAETWPIYFRSFRY